MSRLLSTLVFAGLLAGCSGGAGEGGVPENSAPRLMAQVVSSGGLAVFTGKRSDYLITRTADGYTIRDNAGLTSSVGDARYLQFADLKVDLAMGETAAGIAAADLAALTELYIAYFNRIPDADGLAYWIGVFQSGRSLDQIAQSFYDVAIGTPGLVGYSAGMSDAEFLTIVYHNVLGRTSADQSGFDYWLVRLADGGLTRAALIRTILGAAHGWKGDPTYGWVATLLDNKISVAHYFAVQQGLTYATDLIAQTTALSTAVMPTDINPAIRLIDASFGAGGPQITSSSMTEPQAARLLLQAQFSASEAEIASVRARGATVWINEQLNAPAGMRGWEWLDANGYNIASNDTRYYDRESLSDRMVWNQLMTAPDAVRKRAALALSEMFVVSVTGVSSTWRGYAMASYWDTLSENAFGNFRQLLEAVSLHPATGRYLNTLGNQKENAAGRQPDENYAREVMQLYTIGLHQLNLDGTEQQDGSGQKIETYTAADVSNLARVFTGYQARLDTGTPTVIAEDNNRSIPSTAVVLPPMRMVASQHSTLAVNFLGTSIAANTDAATALRVALDTLANHPNVGPFFARQMIQRLVTSNPSQAYVARVASIFNNNGNGVRGDLKAVFGAILLDEEARGDASLSQSGSGKLREPMLRLVQWGRTFADLGTRGRWKLGDLSNPATQLGQSPLRAPSVFNFFRPGYVPPSTAIAQSGRVAPEFQLVNESAVGGYLNMMQDVIRSGFYTTNSDVAGNTAGGSFIAAGYAEELLLVTDPAALINHLNLLLCAGRLSSENQALILQTLNATTVTAASTNSAKLDRIALAVFLVMASSDYLIQK